MSGPEIHGPDDAREALAAEYALGVLDGAAGDQARELETSDPAFAARVAFWRARLGALAEDVAPVEPPAGAWAAIEARLNGAAADEPGFTQIASTDPEARVRFWRRWAYAASGLAAACLALAVFAAVRPQDAAPIAAPVAPRVATLQAVGGPAPQVVAVITYDPESGALYVSPTGMGEGGGVPHLWLMQDGGAVRLVGRIDPTRPATHSLPAELRPEAGRAIGVAVSLDPVGSHPTAAPLGPVVATGTLGDL